MDIEWKLPGKKPLCLELVPPSQGQQKTVSDTQADADRLLAKGRDWLARQANPRKKSKLVLPPYLRVVK